MKKYRKLTESEIRQLESQLCAAEDWNLVDVAENFSPEFIRGARFSGNVRLGEFVKSFEMPGGISKHSGIYYATLHNVCVGDDCCIENVKNYIANYVIDHETFIENVDIILTDGPSTFGNGVEVTVLNETGGREVMINDRLTAQTAYVMALYRHRPEMIENLRTAISRYVNGVASSIGHIGSYVTIVDISKWREFFLRYRKRIIFGSDHYALGFGKYRYELARNFLEGKEPMEHRGEPVIPIALPADVLQDIYWNNAKVLAGEHPKSVNPEKALAHCRYVQQHLGSKLSELGRENLCVIEEHFKRKAKLLSEDR